MENEADMAIVAADWSYWDGQAALSWKKRLTWPSWQLIGHIAMDKQHFHGKHFHGMYLISIRSRVVIVKSKNVSIHVAYFPV